MQYTKEQQEVLDAIRAFHAAGKLPTQREWNRYRRKGVPSASTITVLFDGMAWPDVVALAVTITIDSRTSWALSTDESKRQHVRETMRAIAEAAGGKAPTMDEWNREKPKHLPRADMVAKLFGTSWAKLVGSMNFVARQDVGINIEKIANRGQVEPSRLRVAPPVMKRIWLGQGSYRLVEARMVI